MSDTSDYKREEDRKWRERVDYEQITIKTAHQVLSDSLEEIQDKLEDIDDLLRGDPVNQTEGILEQLHGMRIELSRLNSTIFMDSTGKRGVAHDVDVLMGRRSLREQSLQFKWQFWTAITVATISAGALVLTQWKEIKEVLPIIHLTKSSQIKPQKVRKLKKPPKKDLPLIFEPASEPNQTP